MNLRFFSLLMLLTFILGSCQSLQVKDVSKANVAIYVKFIPPACGGMPPSAEDEKERFEGQPYALKEVALSIDNENSKILKTTVDGMLYLYLDEGEYCINNKWKADTSSLKNVLQLHKWKLDQACFDQWQARCNLEFKVANQYILYQDTVEIFGRCESQGIVPCISNLKELPQ